MACLAVGSANRVQRLKQRLALTTALSDGCQMKLFCGNKVGSAIAVLHWGRLKVFRDILAVTAGEGLCRWP